MSRTTGAASAAPNPKRTGPKRKHAKRRRGATVRASTRTVLHDVDVLNWVRAHARSGLPSKEIVALSKAAEDWPRPGQYLSDGSLVSCFAAIHHLEEQGVRWPLTSDGKALARARSYSEVRVGKRMHELGGKRAAARAVGDPIVLWDTATEIGKLTGLLISLDIADIELDEHSLDTVSDLHDDMLFLQDWMEQTIGAVQGRLGEQKVRAKITALRAKTVENGCTAEEAEIAQRTADRLERKLNVKLVGPAS
jgi:hypothetical protein